MNRKVFFVMSLLLGSTVGFAQDVDKALVDANAKAASDAKAALDAKTIEGNKNWKCTGVIGLNSSATAFVNWAAGGNNNATGVAFANVSLLYKKGALAWDSNLDTEIGLTYLQNTDYPLQKSNDKINFTTKIGYEFAKSWYVAAIGSFKSQYARGYDYTTVDALGNPDKTMISRWLSPSYTDISAGIDWKPNDIFSLYLSPVAGRISTATDSLLRSRYGIDSDRPFKAQFGVSFKGGVNYTQIKNLKIISTVGLFTPYNDRIGHFDVDWDMAVSYQFLKVLNVTLSTSLKYYDSLLVLNTDNSAEKAKVQFKTILGLGIGYSF